MDTEALLEHAIIHREQVVAGYDGEEREFCPHALGSKQLRRHVLVYQFGGSSRSKLPRGGEWRCFAVDRLVNAYSRPGLWHTSANLFNPQSCLDVVDLVAQPLPPTTESLR
jgi:hypothetical protein